MSETEPTENRPTETRPTEAAKSEGNVVAKPEQVQVMFDRISRVYDVMNLAISGFQEPRWRRRAADAAQLGPGMSAVDVACGTGRVSMELLQRTRPGGRVVGVDFSPGMIEAANARFGDRRGLEFVVGDALNLQLPDATFDAATICFGMRNLVDFRRGFSELTRVVKPGGRVVCLEIARPTSIIGRIGQQWFDRLVPLIGRIAGQGDAYSYLVTSTKGYPPPRRIAEIMREVGLVDVRYERLTFGMVTLHVGTKPA